jgi:two-component system cell cycle sensor histidine kinase PleC
VQAMMSDIAILACLSVMLVVFWRRNSRLTHVKLGRGYLLWGLAIATFAWLVNVLFVGNGAYFDIGFSNEPALEIWRFSVFIPGLILIALGMVRMLPAIELLNSEIEARIQSEEAQNQQNIKLKQAIMRAETAETTLVDAIESMPEAVTIFDSDDRLFICNQPYRDLFSDIADKVKPGVTFEQLVAISIEQGRVPDAEGREEEWVRQRIQEHKSPGEPIEQNFANRRIFRLSETKTKSGGTVSIRTDITEIRSREKALQEERAKLAAAQTIAHIGNWTHNKIDRAHEWSDEVYRILGYEPGSVEPCYGNYISQVHPNDRERIRSVFMLAGERREAFETDFRIIHADGKVVNVRLIGRVNIDEKGRILGASGTIQDITAQHKFERELMQAKLEAEEGTRSKSLFLANMSHELRTPLNAVIGFSEVLAKEIFGPLANDRYREYADNIQASGRHLLSLIDDILEYSRLESGLIELQETEFSLLDIVTSTRTMLAAKAQEKFIGITLSGCLDVRLRADERKLKQVLINLVNNAIKYTPEKGNIDIDLSLDSENFILIRVIDDGFGISKEEIEHVMRPFGRTRDSLTKSIEGTGLGLPLAKSIIELHGGELKIASNKPNPGTTVAISLPRNRVIDKLRKAPQLNIISRS